MNMQASFIQILLVFLVTFVAAIDQFSFLASLYQPIVMGPVIGAILSDVQTGLVVGGTYQLMTIGNMPVGGAQPPNAVIGGIMATVLAISLKLEPAAAVGAAVPFALLGQYGVTLIFALMSPMMAVADKYAHDANPKGIALLNYLAMAALGAIFGLGAAGGMMRFVGFAILLKVMVSKELWGFYFLGFALANIVSASESLAGSALVLLAFIGFAIAYWDFQIQTKFKTAGASIVNDGGEEDGI